MDEQQKFNKLMKHIRKSVTEIALKNPTKDEVIDKLKDYYVEWINTKNPDTQLYYDAVVWLIIYRVIISNE